MKHMQREQMHSFIARRIVLTLAYSEQFSFPLKASELYTRLLVGFFVDFSTFLQELQLLQSENVIVYFEGFLFVSGLTTEKMAKLTSLRKKRAAYAQKKWQEIEEFVAFARRVPFIKGVAVTGSLAVNNTMKDDDIDFMIVTASNRLWLSRLLVILYATLKSKRRSFAKEEKNSWCFNLWVEESELQLPLSARSVYEAYEVVQAVWVLSKGSVSSMFRSVNRWTQKFIYLSGLGTSEYVYPRFSFFELPLLSVILDFCNMVVFWLQYIYMRPHMTREKVNKKHAFFHPRDTKSVVFENWKKVLARISWYAS